MESKPDTHTRTRTPVQAQVQKNRPSPFEPRYDSSRLKTPRPVSIKRTKLNENKYQVQHIAERPGPKQEQDQAKRQSAGTNLGKGGCYCAGTRCIRQMQQAEDQSQGQDQGQDQTDSLRTRQQRRGCYCVGMHCIREREQTENQSPGQNQAQAQTQTQAHVSSVSSVYTPPTLPPTTLFQVPYLVEETHLFWVRRVGGAMERRTVGEIAEELKPGHWAYTCGGVPYFVCDGRAGRGD